MSRKLAIAALLAAACSSLDLEVLEPKQESECGGATKACGWQCVSHDDPSSGCDGTSCEPCPVGPNEVAFCGAAGGCQTMCASGWGDCDAVAGNGCERPLASDGNNCGACGRVCDGGPCESGTCRASGYAAPGIPTAIASSPSGGVYFLATADGGSLWDLADVSSPRAQSLGSVRELSVDDSAAFVVGTFTDTVSSPAVTYDALWQVSLVSLTTPPIDLGHAPQSTMLDVTQDATHAWYTVAGTTALRRVARGNPLDVASADFSPEWPRAVAAKGSNLLVGTAVATGGRAFLYDPAAPAYVETYGLIGSPMERVATAGPAAQRSFGASFADGSVWVLDPDYPPIRLFRSGLPTSYMDLHADADGVYWTDLDRGVAMAARIDARDRVTFVVLLGGVAPYGITTFGAWAYVTDLNGNVWWVPK